MRKGECGMRNLNKMTQAVEFCLFYLKDGAQRHLNFSHLKLSFTLVTFYDDLERNLEL